MKLTSIIGLFVFAGFLFSSCENTIHPEEVIPMEITSSVKKEVKVNLEGKKLMEAKCYACHNPDAATHDDLLAPPFVAVKRRYKKAYDNRADFIDAVVEWSINPQEEEAIMRGAVRNFKVMPNLAFQANEMRAIAEYIYDNEIQQPTWFDAHFKEEHPNGMGNGDGMREKERNH